MVREVVHDVLFLGQKSEPATQADKQVAIDLLDTLKAHEEGCVGMAANMIGAFKIQKEFTIWSEAEKFRSVFPSGSTYETG